MLTIQAKDGEELEFEDDSLIATDDDIFDMLEVAFGIEKGDTIREVFEKIWKGKVDGVDELT